MALLIVDNIVFQGLTVELSAGVVFQCLSRTRGVLWLTCQP